MLFVFYIGSPPKATMFENRNMIVRVIEPRIISPASTPAMILAMSFLFIFRSFQPSVGVSVNF